MAGYKLTRATFEPRPAPDRTHSSVAPLAFFLSTLKVLYTSPHPVIHPIYSTTVARNAVLFWNTDAALVIAVLKLSKLRCPAPSSVLILFVRLVLNFLSLFNDLLVAENSPQRLSTFQDQKIQNRTIWNETKSSYLTRSKFVRSKNASLCQKLMQMGSN